MPPSYSGTHVCSRCGLEQPIDNFSKSNGYISWCKSCRTENTAKYRNKRLDEVRANAREYSAKQRALYPATAKAKALDWYNNNKGRARELKRMSKQGVTPSHYQQLWDRQRGLCAICESELNTVAPLPHIDHCHTTKLIRGLLCRHCNWGLGHFKDSIKVLKAAIKYLTRHPKE